MDSAYLEQDGLRVALSSSRAERAFEALRMLLRHASSALRYGVLALVACGLVAAWGRPGPRGLYVAAIAAVYFAALYALTASAGYVSRRHVLPPLLPLFGYAGLGALAAGAWLAARAGAPYRAGLVGAVVAALVAVGEGISHIEPKRSGERALRRAAEWLGAEAAAPGPVAAPRQRFGYYAGMPYVPLAGVADDALDRYLSRAGARYVLLDDPSPVEALLGAGHGGFRVLHRVEASGRVAVVLERRAEAGVGSDTER